MIENKKSCPNIRKPQWPCRTFAASKNNAPSIEVRCTKVQTPTQQGVAPEPPKGERREGPKIQNIKYKI